MQELKQKNELETTELDMQVTVHSVNQIINLQPQSCNCITKVRHHTGYRQQLAKSGSSQ